MACYFLYPACKTSNLSPLPDARRTSNFFHMPKDLDISIKILTRAADMVGALACDMEPIQV